MLMVGSGFSMRGSDGCARGSGLRPRLEDLRPVRTTHSRAWSRLLRSRARSRLSGAASRGCLLLERKPGGAVRVELVEAAFCLIGEAIECA